MNAGDAELRDAGLGDKALIDLLREVAQQHGVDIELLRERCIVLGLPRARRELEQLHHLRAAWERRPGTTPLTWR